DISDKFSLIEQLSKVEVTEDRRKELLQESKKLLSEGKKVADVKQVVKDSVKKSESKPEKQPVVKGDIVNNSTLLEQDIKKITLRTEAGEKVKTIEELILKKMCGLSVQISDTVAVQVFLQVDNGNITVFREFVELEKD
ncbi:MAG TPA: hypothetical protein VIY47_11475, partial [Ignavibacteriaceae bacterium]